MGDLVQSYGATKLYKAFLICSGMLTKAMCNSSILKGQFQILYFVHKQSRKVSYIHTTRKTHKNASTHAHIHTHTLTHTHTTPHSHACPPHTHTHHTYTHACTHAHAQHSNTHRHTLTQHMHNTSMYTLQILHNLLYKAEMLSVHPYVLILMSRCYLGYFGMDRLETWFV